MTTTLAITGKSGSGKTTIVKNFMLLFKELFPEKSILLFDNDLAGELGSSFGLNVRKTIYGIRVGKESFCLNAPSDMPKHEYLDWALEDMLSPIDENIDLIVSWLSPSKDCRCPITEQLREAIKRLIQKYDFVIFDCEFDLKYLSQLIDFPFDTTIITATTTEESITLAKKIYESSKKYACEGQIGVIINRVKNGLSQDISDLLKEHELDILGILPKDKNLKINSVTRDSIILRNAIKEFYGRLNLPRFEAK